MMDRAHLHRAPAKRHLFRGRWLSAKEIAALVGVTERTINRRIQFDLPLDGEPQLGPKPRRYDFRGEHLTVKEIMAITGLSRASVHRHVSGNRVLEGDELKDPDHEPPANAHVLFFKGVSDTIAGWSRRTGIPACVIHGRVALGWPVQRALTIPSMADSYDTITYRGRTMTVREWALELGLPRTTLHTRLATYGWPVERALSEPVTPMKQRHLRNRNRKIIRRMVAAFSPPDTGGYPTTSAFASGTGVGRREIELEGTSP
jgi:predicted DNA-binding transcriptional regulator AlpA